MCVCVCTQLQQKVGLLTSELQESRDKMSELNTEQQQVCMYVHTYVRSICPVCEIIEASSLTLES